MRKWAVNFFDGVNVLYRVVYASACGFTVTDKFLIESDECNVLYQGKNRDLVINLLEETGNVTQAIIDMVRAYPLSI